jgi:hypothetical protein
MKNVLKTHASKKTKLNLIITLYYFYIKILLHTHLPAQSTGRIIDLFSVKMVAQSVIHITIR